MALPDLTGQHIEDTYPRLLHIDSGSKLIYNGIGSLVDVLNATASFAVTASYAISASYEIVKEVSSSYAETASLVIGEGSGSFSGSFQGDGSGLTGINVIIDTGSLLTTASFSNPNLTFKKADSTTFDVDLTSLTVATASYALNSELLNGKDSTTFTSTSSFNTFTSSYYTDSASVDTQITNNSVSISLLSSSFLVFSASYNTGSFTGSFTGSLLGTASWAENAVTAFNTPNAVITASNIGNDDTIEFLKGGGGTFAVTVNNVQNSVSSSYALTASYVNPLVQNVIITGSIDVLNGHVNLNSNSYFLQGTSTGGSNVELIGVTAQDTIRIGNQGYDNIIVDDTTISGSLNITGTCKSSLFLNRQLLTQDQTVPSTDNGMLTGPISISESINLIVESPSTLVIL